MNEKVTAAVLEQMQGRRPDEILLLVLRTNMVLTTDEIELLTGWGGTLLYDCGNLVLLYLPVANVDHIAAWPSVIEVR
jgi:hypothetical protein